MLVVNSKSNLTCEAGCGLTVLWSDYSRIMLGTVSDRPRIGNDFPSVFKDFRRNLRMEFLWQAQYLVMLEGEACCSAHCK